jgi:hypothetical protein
MRLIKICKLLWTSLIFGENSLRKHLIRKNSLKIFFFSFKNHYSPSLRVGAGRREREHVDNFSIWKTFNHFFFSSVNCLILCFFWSSEWERKIINWYMLKVSFSCPIFAHVTIHLFSLCSHQYIKQSSTSSLKFLSNSLWITCYY